MAENSTLQRFAKAKAKREKWNAKLDEAYKFAVPNHTVDDQGGTEGGGEVFDGTASRAVMARAAKLHGSLFPPGRDFMDFEPLSKYGVAEDNEGLRQWKAWAKGARKKFHDAIMQSNFHTEIGSVLIDVQVSTGALLIREGTPENPLHFEAVPISQIIPEAASDGVIRTVFRQFKLKCRDMLGYWPEAKIPPEFMEKGKEDVDHDIVEATIWEPKGGKYQYQVFIVEGEHEIFKQSLDSSPWVVARGGRSPGETMGRGPVMTAMPDIKTVNKMKEYVLQNAAIAIGGIYQCEDDSVTNPENIKLEPGTIVSIAPGTKGLQPLPNAANFNVSALQISEMQESVDRIISGPGLPPVAEGTKSATEISVRQVEQQSVELPLSMRLIAELYSPLCMRILAILSSAPMAESPFFIEEAKVLEKVLKPVPISPMMKLQDQVDVSRAMSALQKAAAVNPDVMKLIKLEDFTRRLLLQEGFPADCLYSEDELEEQRQQVEAEQQQMQGAVAGMIEQSMTDPLSGMAGGAA